MDFTRSKNNFTSFQETSNTSNIDEIIMEPYNYLAKNNGKELRRELIRAFNEWLHVTPEKISVISEVVSMLHNASLIVDDIEDGSKLRRGKPAAHCVFGTPLSINSANYAYFLALQKLMQLNKPEAVSIFTEQMLELHRGQGMDLFWRCSFRCPSESEYRSMVIAKTGGLFGLAVRLMQLFSDDKTDFKPLLESLGLLFQIRDDYANLVDSSYHKAKTYADDLTEGKFSFPIVCAIRQHPDNNQIMSILCQRTADPGLKRYCVQHMAKLGALDYTANVLADLESRCQTLIESYGGNALLSGFVSKLSAICRSESGEVRRHNAADFEFSQIGTDFSQDLPLETSMIRIVQLNGSK